MAKGDNIRQRKDGRYEARYVKERTENGKAVYASVYGKSYEEVSKKRDAILGVNYVENHMPVGLGLLILGAGSHGQEVHEIASELHIFNKITFLDDDPAKGAAGLWSDAENLRDEYACAIVAVGSEGDRKLWSAKLTEYGYSVPSLVHPTAMISPSAKLGPGTVVCARSIISAGAEIGTGCIISAAVTVGRGSQVPDWTHIDAGGLVKRHDETETS